MVDPVDTIERIFKMAMWVKEKLDQMQTNQELCQRLVSVCTRGIRTMFRWGQARCKLGAGV